AARLSAEIEGCHGTPASGCRPCTIDFRYGAESGHPKVGNTPSVRRSPAFLTVQFGYTRGVRAPESDDPVRGVDLPCHLRSPAEPTSRRGKARMIDPDKRRLLHEYLEQGTTKSEA